MVRARARSQSSHPLDLLQLEVLGTDVQSILGLDLLVRTHELLPRLMAELVPHVRGDTKHLVVRVDVGDRRHGRAGGREGSRNDGGEQVKKI